jgi:hypothetical protein
MNTTQKVPRLSWRMARQAAGVLAAVVCMLGLTRVALTSP